VLIPCIDLQNGRAVQLVCGRRRVLAVEDVFGLLERFRGHRWLHVIDLDAAMRKGSNLPLVQELCRRARRKYGFRVRVGGGVRTVTKARSLVRAGAHQVIVGSAAFRKGRVNHALLRRLCSAIGRKRLVVALDSEHGRIVVRGWKERLELRPEEAMGELEPYCGAFFCTCVEREGAMKGTRLDWYRELRGATRMPILAAGGVSTRREIRALEKMGMDAAVGMALYRNKLR
jgi:phosphoribosylformimino-5-aminoimidazole carboxamide ribotide isomerase